MEKKKCKRRSIRIKEYDYSQKGMYFITICTQNRRNILSTITVEADDHVRPELTPIGKIVENEIINTNKIRENVKINQYIIMPNHIHMIIEIYAVGAHCMRPLLFCFLLGACNAPLQQYNNGLNHVIKGLKGAVTKKAKEKCGYLGRIWQRNYYEHIIRNEKEYWQIYKYIETNPIKWKYDPYYS